MIRYRVSDGPPSRRAALHIAAACALQSLAIGCMGPIFRPQSPDAALTKAQQIDAGGLQFKGTCSTCHQDNGEGMAGVFPPLAKSDFLLGNPQRAIEVVLNGISGPVTVNGKP